MAKTATYTVQLAKNFQQPTRWRLGLQFQRNVPQVLELTAEEVAIIKDDRYMEIKKGAPKDKSADAGSSESDVLSPAGDDTQTTDETDEEDQSTTDDSQTSDSDEEETSDSEDQTPVASEDRKVKLLQKSRNAVNGIAKKLGVENADQMANKEVVADAIIEAEAKLGE